MDPLPKLWNSSNAAIEEPRDGTGARPTAVPTREWKAPSLESIYALSEYDQERMCPMIGRAYSILAVAMRFSNAFGPSQALYNPHTGVPAIFALLLMNNTAPSIFEDGRVNKG
jgi:dTDP-L-rhamnose 4-epimerase